MERPPVRRNTTAKNTGTIYSFYRLFSCRVLTSLIKPRIPLDLRMLHNGRVCEVELHRYLLVVANFAEPFSVQAGSPCYFGLEAYAFFSGL